MNESYRKIVGKEISDLIDKYESQNKNNKQAINKLYVHVVPKEINDHGHDMYYVGITSRTLSARSGINGKEYEGPHFRPAINKYGWDAMRHDVISDRLLRNEAEKLEVMLIAYLKSSDGNYGYNCSLGGTGGNQKPTIRINQYDLFGYYINTFKSAADAARNINVKHHAGRNQITHAAKFNKTAYGYIWRYEKDCNDYEDIQFNNKYAVLHTDINGETKTFHSAKDAANALGVTINMVRTYIHHKVTPPDGSFWRYVNDELNKKYEVNMNVKCT